MKYYTALTPDGRIGATSATCHLGGGEAEYEFPEDFDFSRQSDWRLVDGALVHDPLPTEPTMPTLQEQVNAISAALLEMVLGGGSNG